MTSSDLSSSDWSPSSLPVIHVYLPLTWPARLSSYFQDNLNLTPPKRLYVLGQWEIKGKMSGHRQHRRSQSDITPAINPETRRRSSRISSQTPSYLEPPVKKKPLVFAMSIAGISSNPDDVSDLQILGTLSHTDCDASSPPKRSSPLQISFVWDASINSISISSLLWNGQLFYPSPSHLLFLYYNPEQLLQWKLPDSYPLGLPSSLLSTLSSKFPPKSPSFSPAFPQIPLDHQNLHETSQIPSTSFLFANPPLKLILQHSSGAQQILHKLTILFGVISKRYPLLPVINFLILLLIDSILGYYLTRYLVQFPDMVGLLHTTVDQMLVKLNHLLKWLRGAPAGLKLNPNLNSLYWRFFSYHIHLWANYIGILEPIFALILTTIQYFGVLGASIQISLAKDLLSLATFHVYCLYIYATRLYSLQTTAIKALCRVFFGRKYNPLRRRIDSVSLTTPELFLSSFGFVILIFLLPTTMVYYTGFLFLRVPVLILERLLRNLVLLFNKLPLIPWLLVYLNSPRVADEIYLKPVSNGYQGQIRSYLISLQSTRKLFISPSLSSGFKQIVASIMDGTVLKD